MSIYLDYNAGAPLRREARWVLEKFIADGAGNPASIHRSGQRARRALEIAREQVAAAAGAAADQIVFTSGGTESNNLAIFGAVQAQAKRRTIITAATEHSSILAPLAELERRGYKIIRLAPDRDGLLDPRRVFDSLNNDTAILTLGVANSETGVVQKIAGLADAARDVGALFHIDAAQALGRIAINFQTLGCDLMTLSGHKLGAPAGIGALCVRDGARQAPLLVGGPQERGLRAGTPNLAGAMAMGAAAAASVLCQRDESQRERILRDLLWERLSAIIPNLRCNGAPVERLPNTLNLTFPDVLGESLLIALDLEGVEASMGSACAAGAVEPSHVLIAMARSASEARSSLRLSLGWATTAQEIESAAEIIARVWHRVRLAEPRREFGAATEPVL